MRNCVLCKNIVQYKELKIIAKHTRRTLESILGSEAQFIPAALPSAQI